MRKSGKTFLMIGLIASVVGFVAILVLLIYNLINHLEFLSDTMRMQLRMAAGYLLVVSILSAISINSISKGLHIAGIVICAISLYQTFGVVTFSLVGFIIKAIDITNLEKGQQRRNGSARIENGNTVQNYNQVNIDYKIYVKNHIGSYIVSIIFSIIYLCLYGYGFYALAKLLFGARDGAAIPGGILFILLSPFLFIILFIIIFGLLAPIMAIKSPSNGTLKYNVKMGFLSLTFVNAYASKNILNQIDIDNRNSTRY